MVKEEDSAAVSVAHLVGMTTSVAVQAAAAVFVAVTQVVAVAAASVAHAGMTVATSADLAVSPLLGVAVRAETMNARQSAKCCTGYRRKRQRSGTM